MENHYYRDGDLQVRMAFWDEGFSQRHRQWGYDCPADDIDQIVADVPMGDKDVPSTMLVETSYGRPYALVEYKHERGLQVDRSRYARQWGVYTWMADRCGIPAFCVFYRREDYAMYIVPLNDIAKGYCKQEKWVPERLWVKVLYRFRGMDIPERLYSALNSSYPEQKKPTLSA